MAGASLAAFAVVPAGVGCSAGFCFLLPRFLSVGCPAGSIFRRAILSGSATQSLMSQSMQIPSGPHVRFSPQCVQSGGSPLIPDIVSESESLSAAGAAAVAS